MVKVVIPQLLFLQCYPLPYCSIPALHGFLANSTLTTEQKKINKYDFSHREREREIKSKVENASCLVNQNNKNNLIQCNDDKDM